MYTSDLTQLEKHLGQGREILDHDPDFRAMVGTATATSNHQFKNSRLSNVPKYPSQ